MFLRNNNGSATYVHEYCAMVLRFWIVVYCFFLSFFNLSIQRLFLYIFFQQLSTICELIRTPIVKACSASLDTILPVTRCPRNNLEWDLRSAFFNCSSIIQNCSKPELFKYHCVLNENCTALVEVCAPTQPIHGIQLSADGSIYLSIWSDISIDIHCNASKMF